ncbi:DNA mismatch repair protein Mlh3p [[Candida] railenensis]|uniref:DNA mismatch repair protein Mlh3p n=1 Tax=[Candida] railenensis TaxID=45579 RepID=A0A9P0QQI3_9ASCO|nr:DNA mismatch repair protein Mlh3p [[Candida] railenensis]
MRSIAKLNEEVSSHVDASAHITNVSGVIRELLRNSIDANATKVSIILDLATFSFQVCDNGQGIAEEDFSMVGLRNHSSRDVDSNPRYRHKGNSLYSMSQLGIISIVSKVGPTMVRIYREKREMFRGEQDCKTSNPNFSFSFDGEMTTSVAASNMFANIPIRRSQLENMPEHRVLEDIRSVVFECMISKCVEMEVSKVSVKAGEESQLQTLLKVPSSVLRLKDPVKYGKLYSIVYGKKADFKEVDRTIGKCKIVGTYDSKQSYKSHICIIVNREPFELSNEDLKKISKSTSVAILKIDFTEHPIREIARSTKYYNEVLKIILEVLNVNYQFSPHKDESISPHKSMNLHTDGSERTSPVKKSTSLDSKSASTSPLKRLNLEDEDSPVSPSKRSSHFTPLIRSSEILQQQLSTIRNQESASHSHFCTVGVEDPSFSTSNITFKRQDLKEYNFKVIRQLDKKFILLTTREPFALLAIDQHACDERIRYERLLKTLIEEIKDKTIDICVPLKTEVDLAYYGVEDREAFAANLSHFQTWGVKYKVEGNGLVITHLPRIIIDKLCSGFTTELSKYLLQYVYEIENKLKTPISRTIDLVPWYENIRNLPKVLIDIISTKACRSSIVFGTELTTAEMNHLVLTLGECEYPFQCAHGRPSIVGVAK